RSPSGRGAPLFVVCRQLSLGHPDDWGQAMAPDGALEALSRLMRGGNFEEVLDVCRERNAAVQAIKSIARGPGPPPPGRTRPGTSRSGAGGHRPRGPLRPRPAGCLPQHRRRPDVASQVLEAASRFERRPSDDEMSAMLDSTRMTSLFGLAT